MQLQIWSQLKVKKVKWTRYKPGVAQRVGRDMALLFHDYGTRRGWVVSSTPRPHFTTWKDRYQFYRRLGGPQSRSRQVRKILSPPGFDPELSNPLPSHYTDWATRPTWPHLLFINHMWCLLKMVIVIKFLLKHNHLKMIRGFTSLFSFHSQRIHSGFYH